MNDFNFKNMPTLKQHKGIFAVSSSRDAPVFVKVKLLGEVSCAASLSLSFSSVFIFFSHLVSSPLMFTVAQ